MSDNHREQSQDPRMRTLQVSNFCFPAVKVHIMWEETKICLLTDHLMGPGLRVP